MNLNRSSYYYRSKEKPYLQKKQETDIRDRIEHIVCEYPGYGYRRVTKQLEREGYHINHKRVLRIMRENFLLHAVTRSYKRTTNSKHPYPRYPNLIKNLDVERLNQVWVADITYIRIQTSFVYLAVILDSYSRKVIGYSLSHHLDTELASNALKMAIETRKPETGCIHHSDQGVQYASYKYVKDLKDNGFQISMSSKGNPYENAKAESFFKTLKYEEVYLWNYKTFNDVIQRIPYFIQEVYNKKRLHSSIGYLPPEEFEEIIFVKEQEKEQNKKQGVLSVLTN